MTELAPSDAVVALRSLPRRFRGALTPPNPNEEQPLDDLAHRPGSNGRSALDHVSSVARSLTLLQRAVEQVLHEDDPVLHAAVVAENEREYLDTASVPIDQALLDLEVSATSFANAVEHVSAPEWSRQGRVAGQDTNVTAAQLLRQAVDEAVAGLKAAERTMDEARTRR